MAKSYKRVQDIKHLDKEVHVFYKRLNDDYVSVVIADRYGNNVFLEKYPISRYWDTYDPTDPEYYKPFSDHDMQVIFSDILRTEYRKKVLKVIKE